LLGLFSPIKAQLIAFFVLFYICNYRILQILLCGAASLLRSQIGGGSGFGCMTVGVFSGFPAARDCSPPKSITACEALIQTPDGLRAVRLIVFNSGTKKKADSLFVPR
jgi:hypothetical protein